MIATGQAFLAPKVRNMIATDASVLAPKVRNIIATGASVLAPKVRNIIARGKRAAKRSASPLDHNHNDCEALKERNKQMTICRTFSALFNLFLPIQGRRASLRSALAPGYHISHLRCEERLPRWLSYFAPSVRRTLARWLSYFAPSVRGTLALAIIFSRLWRF